MNPMPDTGITLPDAPSSPVPAKRPWMSKTLISNALIALLYFYPPANTFLTQYPTAVPVALAAFNFLLRLVTHGKISLED